MPPIILASSSPRRKELLAMLGLKIQVDPSNYEENITLKMKPISLAKLLAEEKTKEVAKRHRNSIIIGADTIGVLRKEVFGKPRTKQEAINMITKLSGKTHSIITAYCIIDTKQNHTLINAVTSKVTFKKLEKSEIQNYVDSGEPLDKAAAYAIQGLGALLIKKFSGDFFNIIGLPINALANDLKKILIWGKGRGLKRMKLWNTNNNKAAEKLYRKLGFQPTEKQRPLESNPKLTISEFELKM